MGSTDQRLCVTVRPRSCVLRSTLTNRDHTGRSGQRSRRAKDGMDHESSWVGCVSVLQVVWLYESTTHWSSGGQRNSHPGVRSRRPERSDVPCSDRDLFCCVPTSRSGKLNYRPSRERLEHASVAHRWNFDSSDDSKSRYLSTMAKVGDCVDPPSHTC